MLTNKQVQYLKSSAHSLHFLVQTGDKGLTEAVHNEITAAITAHELIKIKLNADRDERKKMTQEIIKFQEAELIQEIGKVIIIYKENTKNPKIDLPK